MSGGAGAYADEPVDPWVDGRRLSRLVQSAEYREDLERYLRGYESWIGPCPDPQFERAGKTLVLQQTLPFPGVPEPGAPQWIDVVRVTGCAKPYQRAVYATVHEGRTKFFAQLLGTTRAEPVLQDRALKALVAAGRRAAVASGCPSTQPFRILTTSFVSEWATEYGRAWREKWTLADCHGPRVIAVEFSPEHTGAIGIGFAGVSAE